MRLSMLIALLTLSGLLFSHEVIAQSTNPRVLRLGTGSTSGNYFRVGNKIKELCESMPECFERISIEVVSTKGSVDNIKRIRAGEFDLSIVQNDIAYTAENGMPGEYGKSGTFDVASDDLYGVMTFYPEPIYIIVPSTHSTVSSSGSSNQDSAFVDLLKGNTISIGLQGSGTAVNATTMLKAEGLFDTAMIRYDDKGQLARLFEADSIQAAFLNSFPPGITKMLQSGALRPLSLPPALVERLRRRFPYFDSFDTRIENVSVNTLAVKSMLVVHASLEHEPVYRVTKVLYDQWDTLSATFPDKTRHYPRAEITSTMALKRCHGGAQSYYSEAGVFRQAAPPVFIVAIFIPVVFLVALGLLNLALFSFNKRGLHLLPVNSGFLRKLQHLNLTIIQHKYVLLALLLAGTYLANLMAIESFEQQWSRSSGSSNLFQDHDFLDNLLWLFVFSISGYDGNRFPQSTISQVIATMVPLIGLSGLLALVGLLTSDHVKNRMLASRGMKTTKLKNHILLCGWNENVPHLARNLVHENISRKRPVVILADIEEDMPLVTHNLQHELINFIRGTATRRKDLDKANLVEADIAILVADGDAADPDATTILKILTIETYCKELETDGFRDQKRKNIYTIAEISNTRNFSTARDAKVDEIISLGHIRSKIFAKAAHNPGVSSFINEILTYDDFNDIYSIDVMENSALAGSTFDEILRVLRTHHILLLSISIFKREDPNETSAFLKTHNLSRRVITNPIDTDELRYRTQPGDSLIVLAQYEDVIVEALKKLSN